MWSAEIMSKFVIFASLIKLDKSQASSNIEFLWLLRNAWKFVSEVLLTELLTTEAHKIHYNQNTIIRFIL